MSAAGGGSSGGSGNLSGCFTYHNITYQNNLSAQAAVASINSTQLAVTFIEAGFNLSHGECDPSFRFQFKYDGKIYLTYTIFGRDTCYKTKTSYYFTATGNAMIGRDAFYGGPLFHYNTSMIVNMYANDVRTGGRALVNPARSPAAVSLTRYGSGLQNKGPL